MSAKKCCVPGCTDSKFKKHRFPKSEPEIFCQWLANINNNRLVGLDTEKIYQLYRVCEKHFSSDCIVPGTKRGLMRTAIPTLHLSKIVPVARTPECSKKPLVVLKIENKNDVYSPKENLGSSEIVGANHPIVNIVCDIDSGNSTSFLNKSLECRTCLEILKEDNNISLDTEVMAEITVLEALKKLADIQVPETDLLPQQICEKCFNNLHTAIHFSTQIISSDEKLKRRLPSLTDPLLIKPEPCIIKTEEFNTLDNNVNKPLEDIETETFKMEVVEENVEKFPPSRTADDFSNANPIKIRYCVTPKKDSTVGDYLKKKYLYESTIPVKPPEESLKKLPPKEIVRPEHLLCHNNVFRKPIDNSCLCPECGKIFQTRINCQSHIKRMHDRRIRTSEKACLCPKCGKMFNTRQGCQQHIQKLHIGLIKKPTINYLCPDCGQFISGTRKKLLAHMAKHPSNKTRRINPALCPECGQFFKSKWNYAVHLKDVHSKNVAIPRKIDSLCPDCGRSISGSKQKFLAHWILHHSNKIS